MRSLWSLFSKVFLFSVWEMSHDQNFSLSRNCVILRLLKTLVLSCLSLFMGTFSVHIEKNTWSCWGTEIRLACFHGRTFAIFNDIGTTRSMSCSCCFVKLFGGKMVYSCGSISQMSEVIGPVGHHLMFIEVGNKGLLLPLWPLTKPTSSEMAFVVMITNSLHRDSIMGLMWFPGRKKKTPRDPKIPKPVNNW